MHCCDELIAWVCGLCCSSMFPNLLMENKSKSCSLEQKLGDDEFQEFLQTLQRETNCDGNHLYQYQGFWCPSKAIWGIISSQRHFQALDTDLIITSTPKSGTTWLKALIFSIVNRSHFALKDSPLHTANPHDLVPSLEFDLYNKNQPFNHEERPCPRILQTHIPYAALPVSIKQSGCRMVYICRNPLDQLISEWHFLLKLPCEHDQGPPMSLDENFELFCKGIHGYGPFWDHVLGYWQASLVEPNKVLFLKYEDLKMDTTSHMKKLAHFLGFPFTVEEESNCVIEEISRLCSFENLRDLQVNKAGELPGGPPNSSFFRKAKVGDWANYFTPSMAERLQNFMEEKLDGSGLTFKASLSRPPEPVLSSTA